MSLYATPLLYFNLGGEMLYVLQQRLKDQNIYISTSIKVLNDVTLALLNPAIVSTIFEPTKIIEMSLMRQTLERVVSSSIMRLDNNSMDKLFDLMIMIVKYQFKLATGPRELLLLTLNHTDAMRDMVTEESTRESINVLQHTLVTFYGKLTHDELWQIRDDCLESLKNHNVRITVLLRNGFQNEDATFNLTPHNYDERYEMHRDELCNLKIDEFQASACEIGSFEPNGDRVTVLGRNIYLPTYGIVEKPSSTKPVNQSESECTKDYASMELGMLAAQLGAGEETICQRPFTLNLLSNVDGVDINKNLPQYSLASSLDNERNVDLKIKSANEDYKIQLRNFGDFADEEDNIRVKSRDLDLLELFDKAK